MTVHSCYRGTRVLITGLTGFKGTWLAAWLERLGAEVRGLGLPAGEAMSRGWPGREHRTPCEVVDIRDPDAVATAVARHEPEIIFHLAAQALVRPSYERPAETFATNILGTVHVLEAARRTPAVRAVVGVTSDKCYENREWHWGYREDDPLGGHDPYSASKGCAEIVLSAYRRSYGSDALRIASARAGNVIGGGDFAEDRLVPDLVRGLLSGEPVRLRRPNATRPWQHVLEPLSGYLLVGERLLAGDDAAATAWNFGPRDGEAAPVRDIARSFIDLWGRGRVIEDEGSSPVHEAKYLKLDSSKAAGLLGWSALLDVPRRLRWTAEWYQAWAEHPESVWSLTDRQIACFEEEIRACPSLAARWFPESRASSAPRSHAA